LCAHTPLQKYTRETDEDYAVLEDALAKIQVLCNYVNESKRLAENRSKIVEIQHMVKGEFDNLLQPHRQVRAACVSGMSTFCASDTRFCAVVDSRRSDLPQEEVIQACPRLPIQRPADGD
jgi:hypothetical protein